MLYMTRHNSGIPVIVGEFFDDSVLASTAQGEVLRLDRLEIETPVMCCSTCLRPATLKKDKQGREFAECPDHERHMYEQLYAGSIDTKQYNRESRRRMHKEAGRWLSKWKIKQVARAKNGSVQPPDAGRKVAEQKYHELENTNVL